MRLVILYKFSASVVGMLNMLMLGKVLHRDSRRAAPPVEKLAMYVYSPLTNSYGKWLGYTNIADSFALPLSLC